MYSHDYSKTIVGIASQLRAIFEKIIVKRLHPLLESWSNGHHAVDILQQTRAFGCNFVDPNANKHHRNVVAAKKKAPFVQDTPVLADLEDGDWEDSQLYAAWAAKYDSERTVKFTTWLLIHTAWLTRVPT